MGIIDFFGQLFFFVWFTSAIFWAASTAAFASWARIDLRIAIPAGALFQWIGFLAILITYFVKKQGQAPAENYSSVGSEFGYSTTDSSAGGFGQSNPFNVAGPSSFSADPFGSAPYDSTAFGSAFIAEPVSAPLWSKSKAGAAVVYGSVAVIVAFVAALFMTWFNIITPARITKGINAFSTGFDFWIFISIGVLIGGIILCLKRPSRIAAVLFAWVGTWWLMLATASLTARDVFVGAVDALFQIPNLLGSTDGFTQTWAFDVGAAWYVIFINAALLIGASAWVISVSHKNRQAN